MRPCAPLEEALDRLWATEDCLEAREAARNLAQLIVKGFTIQDRHFAPLNDWSMWRDSGPRGALRELALSVAWQVCERDVGPEAYLCEARRELEKLLEPSRRIADDAARRVSLDAAANLTSQAPTADLQMEADELAEHVLECGSLTNAERRVLNARLALGSRASGREIAGRAGVTKQSERKLTEKMRAKLRPLALSANVRETQRT